MSGPWVLARPLVAFARLGSFVALDLIRISKQEASCPRQKAVDR
jgi:hypothetical protein